jgi:hypothetical protein
MRRAARERLAAERKRSFGSACLPYCAGDANHECSITIDDLPTVIGAWSRCRWRALRPSEPAAQVSMARSRFWASSPAMT